MKRECRCILFPRKSKRGEEKEEKEHDKLTGSSFFLLSPFSP
jgi:hypothetical protein